MPPRSKRGADQLPSDDNEVAEQEGESGSNKRPNRARKPTKKRKQGDEDAEDKRAAQLERELKDLRKKKKQRDGPARNKNNGTESPGPESEDEYLSDGGTFRRSHGMRAKLLYTQLPFKGAREIRNSPTNSTPYAHFPSRGQWEPAAGALSTTTELAVAAGWFFTAAFSTDIATTLIPLRCSSVVTFSTKVAAAIPFSSVVTFTIAFSPTCEATIPFKSPAIAATIPFSPAATVSDISSFSPARK
ncbi:uncharacterized protein BXZ73DRAFT_79199 [Epithele typhae]|uniref:uncharacterized protein n=1 Tax=Epithele typhae TaxID=378194 RepID=UPI00200765F9|nr:uncharacterized protein BXZ73DRAFT_79199 [Epithele typhae]KAH9924641.1 hypothetical protein BXZ73DRAFT_79199 [Epithele typhae]